MNVLASVTKDTHSHKKVGMTLAGSQRNIVDVHIVVVGSSVSVLVIQELDANGLACVG